MKNKFFVKAFGANLRILASELTTQICTPKYLRRYCFGSWRQLFGLKLKLKALKHK